MTLSRRSFLLQGARAGLGLATFAGALHRLGTTGALAAPAPPANYRALVCVFLHGGNDANNMVVPIDEYADYAAVRQQLAIPRDDLLPIDPPSDGRSYGFHPSLLALYPRWQARELAVVVNVGPLIEPLTRAEFRAETAKRPYQLFSHSHQQAAWQSSFATRKIPTGWGGRVADITPRPPIAFPTVTSIGGSSLFGFGSHTHPLVVGPSPASLDKTLALRRRTDADPDSPMRAILEHSRAHPSTLVRAAAQVSADAIAEGITLRDSPGIATPFPASVIAQQLKQVAKLIKLARSLGVTRQMFFCRMGGFDTHETQGGVAGPHAARLRTVIEAMAAFHAATVDLGVADGVITFTMSDFSRTFKPAGANFKSGTDHAWGGHHLVLGGAVRGGDFYGTFPTLALDGPDDAQQGANARGRWIPTTSVDQYAATLARWFGAPAAALPEIFPNLPHFDTPTLAFV